MTDKDAEQPESYYLLMGMPNGISTLEDGLVSYKAKCTLPIPFTNLTLWYLLKRVENLSPHKNLDTGVSAALLIITQILKQPKYLSVGKWVSKLWSIQKWNIIQH